MNTLSPPVSPHTKFNSRVLKIQRKILEVPTKRIFCWNLELNPADWGKKARKKKLWIFKSSGMVNPENSRVLGKKRPGSIISCYKLRLKQAPPKINLSRQVKYFWPFFSLARESFPHTQHSHIRHPHSKYPLSQIWTF